MTSAVAREAGFKEPAVSLAPATAWACGCPVCIANVRGPTGCCGGPPDAAPVTALPMSPGVIEIEFATETGASAVLWTPHCTSGDAGPGRLPAALTNLGAGMNGAVPSLRGRFALSSTHAVMVRVEL